jgi:hypothetical protein
MTAFVNSAPVYEFESSRWTTVGVGLADRAGAVFWAISPVAGSAWKAGSKRFSWLLFAVF